MKNILFVCTGNSCRSVMAEGLFRKATQHHLDKFQTSSAGVNALDGYPATFETIRVMEDEGVNITAHQSKRLTAPMVDAAYKIFVMERIHRDWILKNIPGAEKKVVLLTEYALHDHEKMIDIPDPIGMSSHFYTNVLLTIRGCVNNIAKKLLEGTL